MVLFPSTEIDAAVEVDRLAGDVVGGGGGEVGDELRDFVRLGEALEGDVPAEGFALLGGEGAEQLGIDRSGRDGVDADTVRGEVLGEGAGEGDHAGLGGGVVRSGEHAAHLPGERGHADDAPASARPEQRDEMPAAEEDAVEVHGYL